MNHINRAHITVVAHRIFPALFLIALLSSAQAATYDVGRIDLPSSVSASGDLVLATYSDALNLDPQAWTSDETVGPGPGRLQTGCFSVVKLALHSGAEELADPTSVTFACDAVPAEAQAFGWMNDHWEPVQGSRDHRGRLQVRVTRLTTYAIFIPDPAPGRI